MIGYVVRERGYTIPPIGVKVFCRAYVYDVLPFHLRVSSDFTKVYKVEFEPMGELRRCASGGFYVVNSVTFLELI